MTFDELWKSESLGQWSYSRTLRAGTGLALKEVRHAGHLFARDVRIVGIRVGKTLSNSPFRLGKSQTLLLGSPELPVVGKFYPRESPEPLGALSPWVTPATESLIFSYPNPDAFSVVFKTPGPVLGANSGTQPLTVRQIYLFTSYGKDPPHEPGALVNGARFYPLIIFDYPGGVGARDFSYIRVDYRLAFALDTLAQDPRSGATIKNLAGLFRDNDDLASKLPAARASISKGQVIDPLEIIFDNIEKPLASEIIGEGLSWGDKSDWDNVHVWAPTKDSPFPPTPGANYAAHMHWRWGTGAILPDIGNLLALQLPRIGLFQGPFGLGTPLVDPRLSRQRLRIAVTMERGEVPDGKDLAPPQVRFQDRFENRKPNEIPSDGTELVVWISVEAVRDPSKEGWQGAFFVHGTFFTHDDDIILKYSKDLYKAAEIGSALRLQQIDPRALAAAAATLNRLHAQRQTTKAAKTWERPRPLKD